MLMSVVNASGRSILGFILAFEFRQLMFFSDICWVYRGVLLIKEELDITKLTRGSLLFDEIKIFVLAIFEH